jgi:LmbE family N-acetylglucosaminyl deacetylase
LKAIGLFGSGAPSRVLCLGAHSDDIEIGCGATVLRLLDECPEIHFTWMIFSASPERELEARASAAAFLAGAKSADVRVERFRESHFPWEGSRIKDRLAGLAREIDPELVLTHWRGDNHQDHRTVAELTWNHFRDHFMLEYEIPKWDGDLGRPNAYVAAPAALVDRKVELLMEHFASQRGRPWFREDTFRALLRIRGLECNAPDGFAEAFYAHKILL